MIDLSLYHRVEQDYNCYYWLSAYEYNEVRRALIRKGYPRHYVTMVDLKLRGRLMWLPIKESN